MISQQQQSRATAGPDLSLWGEDTSTKDEPTAATSPSSLLGGSSHWGGFLMGELLRCQLLAFAPCDTEIPRGAIAPPVLKGIERFGLF